MSNKTSKETLGNFKFHLARMATSCILRKVNTSITLVSEINIDKYTEDIYNEAVKLMINAVIMYQKANDSANLINMAKARGITDMMLYCLSEVY